MRLEMGVICALPTPARLPTSPSPTGPRRYLKYEARFSSTALMSDYQFNESNGLAWRKSTFADGVEVKDLGTANGRSMQLVRFAPGASFPLHVHAGPEFIYLLEGCAIQEGQQLSAGWAAVAAAGTTDMNFHSPQGCVFLTVYSD
jgi:glyoxylate utilization-related uncharacterized protein